MARRIITAREQFGLHHHPLQDAYHWLTDDPDKPADFEVEDSDEWEKHHPEDPDAYQPLGI